MERVHYFRRNNRHSLVVVSCTIQTWQDDKLKWDPAKYGNIQFIHVGNHEVWLPDILLYQRYIDLLPHRLIMNVSFSCTEENGFFESIIDFLEKKIVRTNYYFEFNKIY